jgi:hypothetical protein
MSGDNDICEHRTTGGNDKDPGCRTTVPTGFLSSSSSPQKDHAALLTQDESPWVRSSSTQHSSHKAGPPLDRTDDGSDEGRQQYAVLDNNNSWSDDEDDDSSSDDNDVDLRGRLLMESRERNMQRNEEMLSRLGILYGVAKPGTKKGGKTMRMTDSDEPSQKRGMLLLHDDHLPRVLDGAVPDCVADLTETELASRYPFREGQINKLTALLEVATMQSCQNSAFVPPSVIVHGSSGTGKTAIVRGSIDCVVARCEKARRSAVIPIALMLLDAYVDCSALDFPSIEEVTGVACNLFARKLKSWHDLSGNVKKRRRKRKLHSAQHYGRYRAIHLLNQLLFLTKTATQQITRALI